MATGVTLLKEAIYGIVPNLLAKGGLNSWDNTYFPTYCNDVPQTQFEMKNITYPYGYDSAGFLRFEGRDSHPTPILQATNMQIPSNGQGKAITIYTDIRCAEPVYDYDVAIHIRNPDYYTDGHQQMAVAFNNFPNDMYTDRTAMDMVCSPNKSTRYEFDMDFPHYPLRTQRTLVLQSNGALTHKYQQDAHTYVSTDYTYPDAYFTEMDIGGKQAWGFLCGRVNCVLIWQRALTTEELNWLHSAGQSSFEGIIANHIGNYAVEIKTGTNVNYFPGPRDFSATTYPPSGKTGKALLDDAIYAIVPQLLAKGNMSATAQTSGLFPTVIRSDVMNTGFHLYGDNYGAMPDGYGYQPTDGGYIGFDGEKCRMRNYRAYVPAQHGTIWIDVEGEICEEAWSGGGPYGFMYRLGEEGAEIRGTPITDVNLVHTDTEIKNNIYASDDVSTHSMVFPVRYTMALGISGSGDNKVYRSVNAASPSETLSTSLINYFGLYRTFDIGAKRSWAFFKGKVRTILIFPRLLYQTELDWLHTNSQNGFPGLWANKTADGIATIYDSATTTPTPATTASPPVVTTAPPPVAPPSYTMYSWIPPKRWDSRRQIMATDINVFQQNEQYLKQAARCDFVFRGGIGNDTGDIVTRGRKEICTIIKRIPAWGALYLKEASKFFGEGKLALQLEVMILPNSPSYNVAFYPCPEMDNGSFNETDDYRWNTRWSSPVNSSTPRQAQGWGYDDPYGHKIAQNWSSTYILLKLVMTIRNLTDSDLFVSQYDYGFFKLIIK